MPSLLGELLDTECISLWTLNKGRVTTWDDITGEWWDPAHVCAQPGPARVVRCVCGISFLSPATCSAEHTSANIHVINLWGRESRWSWIWSLTYVTRTEPLCDGRRKCPTFNLISYHIHRSGTCLLESRFRDSESQYLSLSLESWGTLYFILFIFNWVKDMEMRTLPSFFFLLITLPTHDRSWPLLMRLVGPLKVSFVSPT